MSLRTGGEGHPVRTGKVHFVSLLALTAAWGCGGAGEGTGTQEPTNRTVDVYLTGDPGRTYAHVWVTLDRVVLTNGITSQVMYERSPTGGLKVDLQNLHDKKGPLYFFLGSKQFPAGIFYNAEITVANEATFVPKAKDAPKIKAQFVAGKAHETTWTIDLAKFKPVSPGTNLVLDITGSGWKMDSGSVLSAKTKYMKLGDGAGVTDETRHLTQTFIGTVQTLQGVGADRSFTLSVPSGPVDVTTSSTTKGLSEKDKPDSFLGEGKPVKVVGKYEGVSETFKATSIEADPATAWAHARL